MHKYDSFYKDMPSLSSFAEIFSEKNFQPVPADWWVALTDVVGSTKAIEAGRYKEVNTAGSICVIAIANHLKDMTFPFIFGGDGMTCLVPGSASSDVRQLLIGTAREVKTMFDLELRVAMVPVKALIDNGNRLAIAKWQVSPYYSQAILDGDGIDQAETYLKTPNSPYVLSESEPTVLKPNFSGYTCRWQDFPSRFGETVALIIKFRTEDRAKKIETLGKLDAILGEPEVHHPLHPTKSKMALFNRKRLNNETAVATGSTKGWEAFKYRWKLRLLILSAMIFMAFKLHVVVGKRDISQSKQDNIQSSDFRKYDNTLKMILAVDSSTREKIAALLESGYKSGDLFYGIHVTDRAMITCFMHNRGDGEVHFVDAADGGYTFAAKQMKMQIKQSRT